VRNVTSTGCRWPIRQLRRLAWRRTYTEWSTSAQAMGGNPQGPDPSARGGVGDGHALALAPPRGGPPGAAGAFAARAFTSRAGHERRRAARRKGMTEVLRRMPTAGVHG